MRRELSESALRTSSPRRALAAQYPEPVPILPDSEGPDTPFEEGAHDAIDPDLRYRMISEAAYYMYQQRGYVDGYDVDDWLQAEAQVDHIALGVGGWKRACNEPARRTTPHSAAHDPAPGLVDT